jgi:YidC/Oxa1 family membrane protein insertase
MDRKAIVIMVISLLCLAALYRISNKVYPPIPVRTNTVSSASNTLPEEAGNTQVLTELGTNVGAAMSTTLVPQDEQTVTLENENARYVFTSIGGGVKSVELKNFRAEVGCDSKKLATNRNVTINGKAPVPIMGIIHSGDTNTLAAFMISKTGDAVRAEAPLHNGLYMIKEFRLSTNYLLKASVRYENRGTQTVSLPERELVIGTAAPVGRHDESYYLGLEWYNGSKTEKTTDAWFANRTMGCSFLPSKPRTMYRAGSSNVVWLAAQNQFFTTIVVPEGPAAEIISRRITLPQPTKEESDLDPGTFKTPIGYQTAFIVPPASIAPGTWTEHRFDIFAGAKEFKILQRLPQSMDLVMGFGGFFGFFAKALLSSMNGLNAIGLPYGLAIIMITVIIKTLFWPLTTASTRSMKRMSALQPQMKAIQEKYKDDPRKMNMKTMEFMKEHKVSPLGGCLPLLLQIPVFFGFYTMLQSAIELRGASFLWACDLSRSDTIAYIAGFPLNLFPLFMGATMIWQSRLTPPSPGMDPAQQAIMKYMPLMMVPILYNFSAGLTLYWTVQNLLSIAQMKLTRTGSEKGAAASAGAKPAKPAVPVTPPKKKK